MNILVNEKNNILQTSSALSPGINLKLEALFSYIYCKTIKTIRKLTSKDTYMNAKEALENGLVDKITDSEELNNLLTGGYTLWLF